MFFTEVRVANEEGFCGSFPQMWKSLPNRDRTLVLGKTEQAVISAELETEQIMVDLL